MDQPQSTFRVTPALAEKTTGITLIHTTYESVCRVLRRVVP
jgi:hypothetical protein